MNAVTFGGVGPSGYWQTTGNAGTSDGTSFLGTTDLQPLELRVNGQRALRLESAANGPNIIGGSGGNYISNAIGATISGGGGNGAPNTILIAPNFAQPVVGATIAGGAANNFGTPGPANSFPTPDFSTISGGFSNSIQSSVYSSIAGGARNLIISGGNASPQARYSTIGGGIGNIIEGRFYFDTIGGTIGGGQSNHISAGTAVTIGGGSGNLNMANGATIAGGINNFIPGYDIGPRPAAYSTIGGGISNIVQSLKSTICGGANNIIGFETTGATIGGGEGNSLGGNDYAPQDGTINGGQQNYISSEGIYGSVMGGQSNVVTGSYGAVAGGIWQYRGD